MRALGACGLVDCILDFVWFFSVFFFIEFLTIILLCNDCLSSYFLLVHFLLWCEEWHFNIYYFSDWGTIVSRTWRTTSLSSLASRLFSQKTRHLPLATRKNYHHDEDIFPILLPSENSKGVMNHQRCCVERHYIRCSFRLICTAIATPLWSETYCALHHRITIFTSHRPSRHIRFPLSMSSNRALLL